MEHLGNPGERRLVVVIGAVVFVDTMFYAAIAPLLPTLTHELHMSKLAAGVMTASYAAGTLVGSLPGGLLAVRAGPKRTVFVGLALLAVSTLAFGLLDSVVALDAARFVEGVGGACSWAGGLAWIVLAARPDRRGALIGTVLAAAIGGSLFGPVIGTVAVAVGRGPAFSAVVLVSLLLIIATERLPEGRERSSQGLRQIGPALRSGAVIAGMWLVALPAIGSGMLNVLGPLRLHDLGAAAAAIGATYLTAFAIEAAISPAVGRISDRRGRLVPLRFGLGAATCVLACFALPSTAVGLAALIVLTQAALGVFWAPAMAMLSDAADTHHLEQGFAAALMNLAWAAGQIVGAAGGGALAKGVGYGLPTLLASGLCAATLLVLRVLARPALRWSTRR